MVETVDTVFGRYATLSRERLELTYDYETSAIYSFKKILSEIGVTHVLDIGANIGVYSIYCSDLALLEKIHAFEPAPAAFELLEQNLAVQANVALFQAHRIAASSSEGSVAFKIVSSLSGANAVVDAAADGDDIINVKAAALDSVLDIRDACVGIKIDVEGHELSAIKGMISIISSNRCYVQVECLGSERFERVLELFTSVGYRYIFSLRDDHLFIHNSLARHQARIVQILSETLSSDLRDLLYLRRDKRRATNKNKHIGGYQVDPLFLPQEFDPFSLPKVSIPNAEPTAPKPGLNEADTSVSSDEQPSLNLPTTNDPRTIPEPSNIGKGVAPRARSMPFLKKLSRRLRGKPV